MTVDEWASHVCTHDGHDNAVLLEQRAMFEAGM
jgi:hypothetical protein